MTTNLASRAYGEQFITLILYYNEKYHFLMGKLDSMYLFFKFPLFWKVNPHLKTNQL